MAKGSDHRGRTSDASKPYDVSNSFVKRVTSRVTGLLPQPSWLSRWMSPSQSNVNDYAGHSTITSRIPATSRADLNLVDNSDNHIPAKKARTSSYSSSPASQNKFIKNIHGAQDISPITMRSEPVAGPSTRPELVSSTPAQVPNSIKVNGDDCSETSESTSGCSSLVPQAQSTVRSLGGSRHGRTILPGIDTSHSFQRRGPSFSTTIFSSPLRTSMRETQRGNSPFYSGRTMYGGSSQAYLTSMIESPQRRVGPTVRPAPAQQSVPLSSTAKRILDALEQFSTPVMDAKRMPVVGCKRKIEGSQRYSELSIPTTPDLLRVKRRERLQLSTSAARQTATASPPSPAEYTLRKEEDTDKKKQTGKVKSKEEIDELRVDVKLPPAVLPVDKLPKIDIAIPPPPARTAAVQTCTRFMFAAPTPVSRSESVVLSGVRPTSSFKFSAPVSESSSTSTVNSDLIKPVFSDSSTFLSRTSSDNSTSHPVRRKSKEDTSSDSSVSVKGLSSHHNTDSWKPSSTTSVQPDAKETNCKTFKKEPGLPCTLQNTQTKISANDKIVSTTNQWICSTCKKDNSSNSLVCTVCQNSLDSNKNFVKSPVTGFGNIFKKPVGTWECSTCMIQNKHEAAKCVACESDKPTLNKTMTTTVTVTSVVSTSVMTNAIETSNFGNQFKKPSGSWNCDSCLVVNKETSPSCESPKPGAKSSNGPKLESSSSIKLAGTDFGNMFKKAPGSWTCDVCMITNTSDKLKCDACETVKPGATLPKTVESSVPNFSFGIPTTSSSTTATFSFGIPKGDQVPDTANNLLKSTLGPVTSQSTVMNQTFSFGIPKIANVSTSETTQSISQKGFQVGSDVQTKASNSKTPVANKRKAEELSVESAKNVAVSLTNAVSTSVPTTNETSKSALAAFSPLNQNLTLSEEKATNSAQLFSFGTNKVAQNTINSFGSNITSSTKSSQPNFLFGSNLGSLGSNVASSTTNTISSSSASNIIKFGDTKTVSSGAGMSSIPSINTQPSFTTPKSTNLFSFTPNSQTKEITFGTSANSENKQSNKSSTPSNETKSTFNSFTTPQNQVPVFGTNIAFTSASKDQSPNPFTLTTQNMFGASENKTSSTTNSFTGFGQTNTFQAVASENKPSAVYTFGSAPAKDSPVSGGFAFNPTVAKQPEPSFGFTGAPSSTAPAKFGFNNSTTASSTTFNFEPKPFTASVSPFNTNESPALVFGSAGNQQPATAFGGQTNQAPVFAFGSQSAQPTQAPAFDFGTNQQQQSAPVAAAPSTTFVFGASPATPAAPAAPAPAFDPNIRPTFNFSQGGTPPVFSAIPSISSTGPAPVRKIRKAVRRTTVSSGRQT